MDIRSDRQKGLSYVELGRKYHMDPRTAKRYAESPQKPEYTLSEPKPIDVFRDRDLSILQQEERHRQRVFIRQDGTTIPPGIGVHDLVQTLGGVKVT